MKKSLRDMSFKNKIDYLRGFFKGIDKVAIAFSGGTDSTLLALTAKDILGRDNVLLCFVNTSFQKKVERDNVIALSKEHDLSLIELSFSILEVDAIRQNPRDRCYLCKREILSLIKQEAFRHGIETVIDGTHIDDLKEYRPGLRAREELGVQSPLLECGLNKDDVRMALLNMGIREWNKASSPCLATRIPYDIPIKEEDLRMIERGEDYLSSLGIKVLRLRLHGSTARIEIIPEEMKMLLDKREDIVKVLKGLGFKQVSMDLEGYRSGGQD